MNNHIKKTISNFKQIGIVSLFLSAFLFSSCDDLWDKDHLFTYTEPQDGVLIHNCSDYTLWHFFSFETGEIIGSCDVMDEAANEEWYNRTDWDLAFHRQNIKSNSGVSGVGRGGIQKYIQPTFDFDAITEAPTTGYVIDVLDSVIYDTTNMMAGDLVYAYTGVNSETKDWAVLEDMMASLWVYANHAFIVRTAEGRYAKIHLMNFKGSNGASGTVTMRYVYQSDGTTNLNITEEEEPEEETEEEQP